eukprot:CAMPEP_0203911702 /NCGR_PEP_ID=MMETSP0359-20131031/52856_1 /ASSEMBLY_ACC=CAM_ASM_000338 /TAXON_ID=268821 /ORGANISM="Scrippsiella Hangoei, Strain SHTV-5" /LENGTH=381 /DNA_ID=CAMNT_0050837483 /DNA_START=49 /DNA_END=1194 /DNA_ORIENTATION=-
MSGPSPAVIGTIGPEVPDEPRVPLQLPASQEGESRLGHACRTLTRSVQSCIVAAVLLGSQVMVFELSLDTCFAGTSERTFVSRFALLSPLYILGPGSALFLFFAFTFDRGRFSNRVFLHRWTWRYAMCNLVASTAAPLSELMRDCFCTDWDVSGKVGEMIWVLCSSVCQVLLLVMVHEKVRLLAQAQSARHLRFCLAIMLVMWMIGFLPILVWTHYRDTVVRWMFCSAFIVAFACSTVIATRALLKAAATAEALLPKRAYFKEGSSRMELAKAISWTRLSAYAALGSMASSICVMVALGVWMVNGYHSGGIARIVADWLNALDCVMNSVLAAVLSGMIGPRTNLDLAEHAMEQMGQTLLEFDKAPNGAEAAASEIQASSQA